LNQVVLHELAHLRRWDDWTNLAQKIVRALFFFHPAVWWIEKKLSLEREMACDDAVLAESASPRSYAECLVHLAEKSVLRRGVALAQAAVGKICQTSLRVAQILDVDRAVRTSTIWKPSVALVGGFALLSVVGISRAPRLVVFQEAQPRMVSASLPKAVTPVAGRRLLDREAKIVKANFLTRQAQPSNPTARLRSSAPSRALVASDGQHLAAVEPSVSQFVHFTDFRAAPAPLDAMFLVVEQDTYENMGMALYRVSVWRIVVLRPTVNSTNAIPRKET
jgi:hypothetical protein